MTDIRFATFNASLNRNAEGELISDLSTPDNAQGKTVAEIIQRVDPDIILINEFDFDAAGGAAQLYKNNYLLLSQNGIDPVNYPYFYIAPSNTGIASGFDLDNNGAIVTTPGAPGYGNDAFGFGNYAGQFGMVVYSKNPIDFNNVRTFQTFLWKDMPGALLPIDPVTGESYYSSEELEVFRLSSKSHWDLPININGEIVHFLVSHPTPPVCDGTEDRNGRRNHDEIRFWSDYITPGENGYIYDDKGSFGGLKAEERFVIAGDQNADPFDGDSINDAVLQLLENPLINTSVTPASDGGVDASERQGGINTTHEGNPAFDTADFPDSAPGNLRVDYVLPSQTLEIVDAGVFWTEKDDPLLNLVGDFNPNVQPTGFPSSDHRLVWVDVEVDSVIADSTRKTVEELEFIGEVTFATGLMFEGTQFGGLSGITYDPFNQIYYAISDDRSNINPARFYTLGINLTDGSLDDGDVTISDVTTLLNNSNQTFPVNGLDAEGIALTSRGTLFISSEGNANANPIVNPFVNEFSLFGQQFNELPVPNKFLPNTAKGIRNNQAFESLTITPDERFLYTAVENALVQDGTASTLEAESAVRILQYDLRTGKPGKEFLYLSDPIPTDSNPPGGFADNGLVELLAIDNTGTFLALERSFANGVGNNLRLYEVRLQGATDISQFESLAINPANPNGGLLEVDAVAAKRLLIDFSELGITLDNSEGLTFGPTLPDGRQSLIVVSDNNFNSSQTTQFLAFALDINSIPSVIPTVETPSEIRFDPLDPNSEEGPDADDPAIYVHPTDSSLSFVIASLKNGGLAVYDLDGKQLQKISPDDIRYNNVDLVYGFNLNGETVDLAVASDRANDTLAIYKIDPTTRQLSDITSPNILESIFGVDDGEQTAYGLTTYTSPATGKVYVFVSQADGNKIAQLELKSNELGQITAEVIRTLTVPIPPDGELEDAQVEGMVADRELGYLYVGQEGFGIWKFSAEPNSGDNPTLVDTVKEINPNGNLEADVEGLSIYYGEDGKGYIIASGQGDSTFALYDRGGSNSYLRSFVVGEGIGIDGVEESDGADIINVPLGDKFPKGLLVVHDGSNEAQSTFLDPDGEEIQNFNTNFKFIDLEDLSQSVPIFNLEPDGYHPRNPETNSLINGIASGDTTQDSTVLWARSTFVGEITFEYATDANFSAVIGSETVAVTATDLPVKVAITDLTPHTTYYYRVTDASGDVEIGQFQTAAEVGTKVGLSFGVSGDWRGELAPYPAIRNVADKNLAFFVEHGDTIYADIASDAVKNPDGTRKEQAETLAEYRAKHGEVYSSRLGFNDWKDLRASTSILATIDDHEVTNDFAGGAPASSDPRFDETEGLINDTQLYENGLQAFQEYNPLRDEFYGQVGDERFNGERQLYRYNTYGSDAAVFVVDTRSFRDEGLTPPASITNPAEIARVLTESLTLDRTLLGEIQLNDLKQDLLDAEDAGITWKFVMIPEPIQNIFPGINTDAYEGYGKERTELLKFIEENDIDNVVFVAADVHTTFVNNLTYQEVPFGEQIATRVFEITTGAVAFEPPTGEFLASFFANNPQTQAFYNSLPIAPDTDDIVNDKDDFVKLAINNTLLTPLGFDPLGLNNNLPQANGLIDANLIQGDYFVGHTYGWTQFDIDPTTQQLRVITYGIESYSEEELLANPDAVLSRTPQIVSEFTVNANIDPTIVGTPGDDYFDAAANDTEFNGDNQILLTEGGNDTVDVAVAMGGNRINLGSGEDTAFAGQNNRIDGGLGDDTFFVGTGGGNNTLTGGEGEDDFVIVTDEQDLPTQPNIITDFNLAEDTLSFLNTSFDYSDRGLSWNTIQNGSDTVIEVFGQSVAILNNVQANSLTEENIFFSSATPIEPPQPSNAITLTPLGTYATGVFDEGAAEIPAFDPISKRLFVVNGNREAIDVLDVSNPTNPTLITSIDVSDFGSPNSVAVKNGLVAIAIENANVQDNGIVRIYNTNSLTLVHEVTVGALPDMLTFTPDGSKILVANEGEPNDDYSVDPEGSVSIIDVTSAHVTKIDFTSFNNQKEFLRLRGVRIFGPDATVAEDFEPEYIAISNDSKTAWITLQENNAIAVLDIATQKITEILPLGVKDWSQDLPQLTQYNWDLSNELLGTTPAGQQIKLGGMSGLFFEKVTEDGKLQFITTPDRGPNAEPTDLDGDGIEERPFPLPNYQPRLIRFTLDRNTEEIEITEKIFLTREVNGESVPLTGLPNLQAGEAGTAYTDETPVDLFGNPLENDPFGADFESIVVASDGTFWMSDEYRPAIYHFDAEGVLIDRFIPQGTAAAAGVSEGTFGIETLPSVYAQRRENRGFEGMALNTDNNTLTAWIQSPVDNPDVTNDATSRNSQILRILAVNAATGNPTGEYVYFLEGSPGVDKIGDAVYAGNNKFYVIERDSGTTADAKKFIFEVDLTGASNILGTALSSATTSDTALERMTAEQLAQLGINPANKRKVANIPSLGYVAGDKTEGLALLPNGSLAIINDNDFGLLAQEIPGDGSVPLNPNPTPTILGIIDFDHPNRLDASDRDDEINLQNWPVFGLYQPDAIATFTSNGQTYLITANEGDAREYDGFEEEERIKDVDLDPTAFPNADELQQDENLGRLGITNTAGDLDGDGDFDQLYSFGTRSFSIWDSKGNLVYDSGDDFERITAELFPDFFNANSDDNDSFDSRSDNKGPEPEGVTIGVINSRTYAFIGLERIGGIMVYDVTNPSQPQFTQYLNNRNFAGDAEAGTAGDLGPEGLTFISAADSPTGKPLLAVANEISGTTTLYAINVPGEGNGSESGSGNGNPGNETGSGSSNDVNQPSNPPAVGNDPDSFQVTPSADGFSFAWNDGADGNSDFDDAITSVSLSNQPLSLQDIIANLQSDQQGELLDLRQFTGRNLQADFTVNREAAMDNFVGFYRIDNQTGEIDGLRPGEAGYTQAAFANRVSGIDLQVNDAQTVSFSGQLAGGAIYAPFLVADSTPEAVTDLNNVYFAFLGANTDATDHARLLGKNVFGFEDTAGGGDRDYNDLIVQMNFTLV